MKLFLFSLSFFIVTVNAKCPIAGIRDNEDRKLAAKKYGDTAHSHIAGSFLKDNMLGHGHKAQRQLKRSKGSKGSKGSTNQCLPVEALASRVAYVRETFAPNIDSDGHPALNPYSICSFRAGFSMVDGNGTVARISGYAFAKIESSLYSSTRPNAPDSDVFMLWVENESPFLAQLVFGFSDLVPGPDLFQGVFDTTKNDIDLVTTTREEGDEGFGGGKDYDFTLHCEPIPSGGYRGYSHGSMFCEATAWRVPGVFEELDTFSNSYTFFLVPGGTSEDVCPCAAEQIEITCEEKCNLGTNRHWAEVSIGGKCASLANNQPKQFGPDGCDFETCCPRGTN